MIDGLIAKTSWKPQLTFDTNKLNIFFQGAQLKHCSIISQSQVESQCKYPSANGFNQSTISAEKILLKVFLTTCFFSVLWQGCRNTCRQNPRLAFDKMRRLFIFSAFLQILFDPMPGLEPPHPYLAGIIEWCKSSKSTQCPKSTRLEIFFYSRKNNKIGDLINSRVQKLEQIEEP